MLLIRFYSEGNKPGSTLALKSSGFWNMRALDPLFADLLSALDLVLLKSIFAKINFKIFAEHVA